MCFGGGGAEVDTKTPDYAPEDSYTAFHSTKTTESGEETILRQGDHEAIPKGSVSSPKQQQIRM